MRYDPSQKTLKISASELVRLARRASARSLLFEEEERTGTAPDSRLDRFLPTPPVTLSATVERDGMLYEVSARAAVEEETVTLAVPVDGSPEKPPEELVRQARGEAFCAAELLSLSRGIERPSIVLLYIGREIADPVVFRECPTDRARRLFFDRLFTGLGQYASAELDRVCRRLPTMAAVPFPYASVRDGQRELISGAYRAVCSGGRLYACAPTGTGKTMSVLFPAVRALGGGFCEKIFYLTSKSTTALAAAEAAKRLADAGAELRGILLSAKERICPRNLACRNVGGERCPLSRSAPAREEEAARDLLASGKVVLDAADLCRMGEERKLCPYELSLRYAMLCDLVICDYNYLFDLRVSLRRFFSQPGNWCFLIDEAHNLVERSRELYSTGFDLAFFDRLRPICEQTPALGEVLDRVVGTLRTLLSAAVADTVETGTDGVRRGFWSGSEVPPGLPEALGELLSACEGKLEERTLALEAMGDLRRFTYDLHDIQTRLSLYSPKFISFVRSEGEELNYRSLCLDPSGILDSRLSLGRSAVLFSATLTPTEYYRTVLGGDRTSDVLDLPSPFDPTRLCVAILDRVGTRYSVREETLRTVARAILTAVKAKPGNYLVFCPSFAYLEALTGAVRKLAPKLPLLRQERHMSRAARVAFLNRFSGENRSALLGFCVLGGIFAEGIDLVGQRLIGSIIIGVGLPQPAPENEAIRAYYDETMETGREYAYTFPGMNRVLQAAGRVIRCEEDRGVVLLIDDRFSEPVYRELIPAHWRGLKYVGNLESLSVLLNRFWNPKEENP